MFENRNTNRLISVLVALAVLMTGGAGLVAADSSQLIDDTTEIDEETSSVWVDVVGVEDFEGDDPVEVEITLTGLNDSDEDLDDTEIVTETLTVDEDETESMDYEITDEADDYDTIEITAEVVEGDYDNIEETEFGTLERVAGGGGGALDGSVAGIPIVIVVGAGLVLFLVAGRSN